MGVTNTNAYDGPFYPNGVTTSFPFTFRTMSTSEVAILDPQGEPISGFSFSIVPSANADGGTIIFDTPPTAGALPAFLIASTPNFGVGIDLGSVTAFNPRTLNPSFERLAVQAIFLNDLLKRSPQTPIGGGADGKYPVVLPGGGWGFGSGTGNDPALRTDLANPALGTILLNYRNRTAKAKLDETPSVRDFGATLDDGTTPQQVYFSAAAYSAIGHINTPPVYAAIPQPLSAEVFVPDGLYHLTDDVDCGGKNITWRCSDGARFTANSAQYLIGKIVRRARMSNAHPSGMLDALSGTSAVTGGGRADETSQVFGITDPAQVSIIPTVDGVGSYSEFRSAPLTHQSAATFTATTAVLAVAAPIKRLRVGMVIQTTHVPWCRGILTGWSADGLVLNVIDWRSEATSNIVTPSNAGAPQVHVGVIHKGWGFNTNVILTGDGYARQGSGVETGIINTVAAPANAEATVGRTWGNDVVNLSGFKFCMGFMARGAGFEGFRATGQDIGFNSAAFASLGYGPPSIGFSHDGGSIAFRQRSAAGVTQFQVGNGAIELGDQGSPSTPFIDFHSSGAPNDYDVRVMSVGGNATSGSAAFQIIAAETIVNQIRPADDNSFTLGTAAHRWSVVFSATGAISTSDPRLKQFIDDPAKWTAVKRAILSLPIKPYQWLDAIALKGEDGARIHVGVNAQEVIEAFASEGLDARRFALFCEDHEVETVEVVTPTPVQVIETVEEMQLVAVVEDDHVVMREQIVSVEKPKTRSLPILNEDGTPFMRKVMSERIEDGMPVLKVTFEPAFHDEPVMRTKDVVTYEDRPTGRTRLGIRYEQLTMLMIAAVRDATV